MDDSSVDSTSFEEDVLQNILQEEIERRRALEEVDLTVALDLQTEQIGLQSNGFDGNVSVNDFTTTDEDVAQQFLMEEEIERNRREEEDNLTAALELATRLYLEARDDPVQPSNSNVSNSSAATTTTAAAAVAIAATVAAAAAAATDRGQSSTAGVSSATSASRERAPTAANRERTGRAQRGGLSRQQLDSLPASRYQRTQNSSASPSKTCAICRCDFESGDTVRTLPCAHVFHMECIDPWLTQKATCPTCKLDIKAQLNL